MWFTKKNTPYAGKEAPGGVDKMAGVLARGILSVQRAFACYLHKKAGSLSRPGFTTALVFFCVLCGGYSSYLVAVAVIPPARKYAPFRVEAIRTPRPPGSGSAVPMGEEESTRLHVAEKIRAYRLLQDSLQKSLTGLYEAIRAGRQGLGDSLRRVEEMDHLPNTK